MFLGRRARRVLAAAGTLSIVGAALAQGAPANGSIYNINQWKASWCSHSAYNWCLYYSPGGANGNSAFFNYFGGVPNLSGYTFGTGENKDPSVPGYGQAVRNNAASLEDGTPNCNVTTWVSPNYVGNYNYLNAGWGGNLTPNSADPQQLRNNEASINVNSCS